MTVSTVSFQVASKGTTCAISTLSNSPGATGYRPRAKENIKIISSTNNRIIIFQLASLRFSANSIPVGVAVFTYNLLPLLLVKMIKNNQHQKSMLVAYSDI
jgi:hypothetical protein